MARLVNKSEFWSDGLCISMCQKLSCTGVPPSIMETITAKEQFINGLPTQQRRRVYVEMGLRLKGIQEVLSEFVEPDFNDNEYLKDTIIDAFSGVPTIPGAPDGYGAVNLISDWCKCIIILINAGIRVNKMTDSIVEGSFGFRVVTAQIDANIGDDKLMF
jgi:hypothetical protein